MIEGNKKGKFSKMFEGTHPIVESAFKVAFLLNITSFDLAANFYENPIN